VGSAGHKIESVPVVHGGDTVVVGLLGVHCLANRFVEVDGRAGGDGVVLFAVDGENLTTAAVEGGEVGVGGLENIFVHVPALNHPLLDSVVGDVCESVEVGGFDQVDEASDPFTASRGDVKLPSAGVGVVGSRGVFERSADLVIDVGTTTLRVMKTIENGANELTPCAETVPFCSGS